MVDVPASGPVTIKTNLADSALATALKAGKVETGLARFDFCGPKVAHDGFKGMVREGLYHAGELAIVTYMQARAYGKPYVMLPATMVGRFQHHCIGFRGEPGAMKPGDIEGKRVGVRSYSQTTGVWVRGVLQHEYGVDLDKVTWCAHDDPHVAEALDPASVERFKLNGRKLADMMLAGDFPAAILGNDFPKDAPDAHYLVPDPFNAAIAWHKRTGIIPVNHVFVVHADLVKKRPEVVEDIWRALKATKAAMAPSKEPVDCLPFGFANLRLSLNAAAQYAYEQKLLPRKLTADDLFDDFTRALT
jgi:4,5-dihydroxyphthalate decarboxylase